MAVVFTSTQNGHYRHSDISSLHKASSSINRLCLNSIIIQIITKD